MTDTRDDHGKGNALAWFQSIVEMVDALRTAEKQDQEGGADETDAPRERIQQSVLSVEVRGDWHGVGLAEDGRGEKSVEYRILLSTGGPAARLIGGLDDHGEPETARLEYQDWGTPWTEISIRSLAQETLGADVAWSAAGGTEAHIALLDKAQEYLLTFARQFYFGEG